MNEYELLSEIDDNIKKLLMVKKKASKHFRQLKKFRKEVLKLCRKNSKIPERLEIKHTTVEKIIDKRIEQVGELQGIE